MRKFKTNFHCYIDILIVIKVLLIGLFFMVVEIGPLFTNSPFLHIFPQDKWEAVKSEKLLCLFIFFNLFPFSLWPVHVCFCMANCCCLFSASVTASRWRSLFPSNVSLAFPYSPVARLSPYSNGINTPSFSKTSNKAILTPERTGNISTSWLAAYFVNRSPNTA